MRKLIPENQIKIIKLQEQPSEQQLFAQLYEISTMFSNLCKSKGFVHKVLGIIAWKKATAIKNLIYRQSSGPNSSTNATSVKLLEGLTATFCCIACRMFHIWERATCQTHKIYYSNITLILIGAHNFDHVNKTNIVFFCIYHCTCRFFSDFSSWKQEVCD